MKRVSNVSSSKARAAAAAVAEHYEAAEEDMTTRKAKFESLYEYDDEEEDEEDDEGDDDEEEEEEGVCGLRQNRRKTWRISTSKNGGNCHQKQEKPMRQELQQQKFVCSKCGKAFQSSKAMCGHMACHSEKEKASSNVVPKQKQLVMDSHSDTESGAKNQQRRPRRTRYKKHTSVAAADSSKAKKVDAFHHHPQQQLNQQQNYNNCSSGASGVEQEQEEVAICLMMLSRDSGNWGGLNSIGDSSDNNSVVLEARSISTKLKNMDALRSSGVDVDDGVKKCGSRKVKIFDNSESGYVRNRAEIAVADVKIKNLRKRKLEEGSKPEPHLNTKKLKIVTEGGSKMEAYPTVNESYSAEMCRRFDDKALIDSQSHQAFGPNAFAAGSHGSSKNRFETDQTRKGKDIARHECLICFKVFRSGQALGGHRRVHLAEESPEESKSGEVAANFKPNGAHIHHFIDLNLPAPVEDEEDASESMASYGRSQAHYQA
uniref:C2H2-type domain-containing protein n=1 Tax=Kalanchoe fedtschenkoi TaxID=63787 RepID=A0A7N0UF95_KALFE